ncbi:copper resistance D family protein [Nocardiopsis alborubida]|uniref:Copper resistance protein D domain-containing protein n=1 Tax=Nocardiopsis alborubida TaxID=146802 RepID=A0A7X6RNW4_9ACTN|nr:CopD family protein [Nocardiopsis alborubida]NKY97210.1 hypothetical protein [Nocardiopsis alborubida]
MSQVSRLRLDRIREPDGRRTTGRAFRLVYPSLVLFAGAVVAAAATTAVLLEPAPPGVPVPGPLVDHGLAPARALLHVGASAAVGFALLPILASPAPETPVNALYRRSLGLSAVASSFVALCAGVCVLLGAAELAVEAMVTTSSIDAYLAVSRTGQALAAMGALALMAAVAALAGRDLPRFLPRELCLLLSATPLLPLTLTGHGESSALHGLMMLSRGGHVVAAALWVGGLLATVTLLARRHTELAGALPRFSVIASCSVLVVALTGVLDAVVLLLGLPGGLDTDTLLSPYVLLCAAKLGCVGLLLALASVIRFRLLPQIRAGRRTAVLAWTTTELAVMGVLFGLAAVLSRTPVAG